MQNITNQTLTDTMLYQDVPVLTYTIHYPYFTTNCSQAAAMHVNNYYKYQVRQKEDYCRNVLYKEAVEQATYATDHEFPFNKYEFLSVYTVTYNNDCVTSLYSDQYTYLGGAHGNTVRDSQTWDFQTGYQLSLSDYFPNNQTFTQDIISEINKQITEREKQDPSTYFEDFPSLVRGNFNLEGFYVTPDGIVIYYQQYDIAPYSTGIPEFFFPFSESSSRT